MVGYKKGFWELERMIRYRESYWELGIMVG